MHSSNPLLFFFLLLAAFSPSIFSSDVSKLETFIVHVERPSDVVINSDNDLERWYRSFLPKSLASSADKSGDRLVYAYGEVFSGFAARLTQDELKDMAKKEGFVRAFPNTIIPLLTTHTPAFLGLTPVAGGVWNTTNLGKGVIVGVLDSGVSPLHPSFDDAGLPPPPSKWKGQCAFKKGCNNKIIGAQAFLSGSSDADPTDEEGHGTHTASTIAGNFVENVNAFGFINGTAAGVAPHAHIAIYKVCGPSGCPYADILAGLDAAVKDGVDVLSLSLGGSSISYDRDPIAIGSFAAIEKGITVVCAGGNSGPAPQSLSNEAPWIITVAASTVDRSFRSTVTLGDGKENVINGDSLFQPTNFSSKPLPLAYFPDTECTELNRTIAGKIVLCDAEGVGLDEVSASLKAQGGAGIIAIGQEERGYTNLLKDLALPGSIVSYTDGDKIKSYINSTQSPTASITFGGTVLGVSPTPVVTFFSSRGPNMQSAGILKPDITAPGLNILAAWNAPTPRSSIPFNVISGTSMSTPHVSGVVALIKSLHPDWSPAAIKSAIVTSSDIIDREGNRIKNELHEPSTFYDSGAGHVNPTWAVAPGLVYDLTADDYIAYLCNALDSTGVAIITRRRQFDCSNVTKITDSELNYPTITVDIAKGSVTVNRTVTNVGVAGASYTAEVDVPAGVKVTVEPKTLRFTKANEKQTFTVTITGTKAAEGNLKWVLGKSVVRSALVFTSS